MAKPNFKNTFSFRGLDLWQLEKFFVFVKKDFEKPNVGRVLTFTKCVLEWLSALVVPKKSCSSFMWLKGGSSFLVWFKESVFISCVFKICVF